MEAKLNMETQFSKEDHDYALTHVHSKDKKGFFSMFVVMLGFTFFSASMLTGGNLGTGLSLKEFFIAVFNFSLLHRITGIYRSRYRTFNALTC